MAFRPTVSAEPLEVDFLRRLLPGASVVPFTSDREDTSKGNRPSFTEAAPPEQAQPLYEAFCETLAALGLRVSKGVFGTRMEVELVNDGPVTIVLDE